MSSEKPVNNVDTLRASLFDTLSRLRSNDSTMDVERATAIAKIGEVIVESAKAENKFLELTNEKDGSGFFHKQSSLPAPSGGLPAMEASADDKR